jgi:hypothetical protein
MAEVRSMLIGFTQDKNIETLDRLIATACLIDTILFEARPEHGNDSNLST